MTVPCWPYGYDTRHYDCDETLPDDDHSTVARYGWGWVFDAPDPGSASGLGPFLCCPEHRSDCSEEQRERARERNAYAKAGGAFPRFKIAPCTDQMCVPAYSILADDGLGWSWIYGPSSADKIVPAFYEMIERHKS